MRTDLLARAIELKVDAIDEKLDAVLDALKSLQVPPTYASKRALAQQYGISQSTVANLAEEYGVAANTISKRGDRRYDAAQFAKAWKESVNKEK